MGGGGLVGSELGIASRLVKLSVANQLVELGIASRLGVNSVLPVGLVKLGIANWLVEVDNLPNLPIYLGEALGTRQDFSILWAGLVQH